jgi:RimJ/RimL family protein N-acetyltransferase
MTYTVYLRPLAIEDALTSCHWRNDPKIWRFTGSRPDRYVTPEMETAWLAEVLRREDEKRFAICLTEDDRYIGNVFFTQIQQGEAWMHIFIGEVRFWGKNRGWDAGWLALEQAFTVLQLQVVLMEMHQHNPGIGNVKRAGWEPVGIQENGFIKHVFTKARFEEMHKQMQEQQDGRLYTRK